MPIEALPTSRDTAVTGPGRVSYRREYLDALGRPMDGSVTIVGQARTVTGDVVVPPAPVTVDLVDGVLSVALPPDTYRVTANLRTVDRQRLADTHEVTLT